MNLERELCFYYSDFYPGNFIFTDSGEVCVIDFDEAGFLPASFMAYALTQSRWAPGHWIQDKIDLPVANLDAMRNISYWFSIGVTSLGKLKGHILSQL